MSMQLFHSPISPFVRKIMVLLVEIGQDGVLELMPARGSPVNTENQPIAYNPLGMIPALKLTEGLTLYDSRVITRYLDDHFKGGLYPKAPRLWDSLVLEATADGIMDAVVLMVYEDRVRPEKMVYPPWVEGQWAKVERALDALDSRWIKHLQGTVDIGQIAVGCALGYLDFRQGERDWRKGRSALAAWDAKFSQRVSMRATIPPVDYRP